MKTPKIEISKGADEMTPVLDFVHQAVKCVHCGKLHHLAADSYVTLHGSITHGEGRVLLENVRVCLDSDCRYQIAQAVNNAYDVVTGPSIARSATEQVSVNKHRS